MAAKRKSLATPTAEGPSLKRPHADPFALVRTSRAEVGVNLPSDLALIVDSFIGLTDFVLDFAMSGVHIRLIAGRNGATHYELSYASGASLFTREKGWVADVGVLASLMTQQLVHRCPPLFDFGIDDTSSGYVFQKLSVTFGIMTDHGMESHNKLDLRKVPYKPDCVRLENKLLVTTMILVSLEMFYAWRASCEPGLPSKELLYTAAREASFASPFSHQTHWAISSSDLLFTPDPNAPESVPWEPFYYEQLSRDCTAAVNRQTTFRMRGETEEDRKEEESFQKDRLWKRIGRGCDRHQDRMSEQIADFQWNALNEMGEGVTEEALIDAISEGGNQPDEFFEEGMMSSEDDTETDEWEDDELELETAEEVYAEVEVEEAARLRGSLLDEVRRKLTWESKSIC